MKRFWFFLVVVLVLVGCGTQQTSEQRGEAQQKVVTDPTDTPGALSHPTAPLDWFDALEVFAERWRTYAGYAFAPDGSRLVLFTTDNRSENSRKMRDEFVALTQTSTGVPEVNDAQGNIIDPRLLPFVYQRATYPRWRMNRWRATLREEMPGGMVNRLNITDETNRVNAQVPSEAQRTALLALLRQRGIPSEAVTVSVGVNTINKTLYDTFTPPAGGVNFQWGSTIQQRCTLGLPVRVNGVAAYLTASHCSLTQGTSNDGSVLRQNAVRYGIEGQDAALTNCQTTNPALGLCQTADVTIYTAEGLFAVARIIRTTGGTGSIDTGIADTWYDVTAVSERPGNGVTVSSIGASSGFRDATVMNSDTEVTYANPFGGSQPLKTLRVVMVQRNASTGIGAGCGGDSGGPWFQITGTNTAKFLGIHSGGTNDAPLKTRPDNQQVSCGYTAYFSPVAQIRAAFSNVTFTLTR